jgi:hypothetical protein
VVVGVLEPYVGRTVADTCVRATALSIGRTSDSLGRDDLPAIESNVRRLLSPIAPTSTVDAIVSRISEEVV